MSWDCHLYSSAFYLWAGLLWNGSWPNEWKLNTLMKFVHIVLIDNRCCTETPSCCSLLVQKFLLLIILSYSNVSHDQRSLCYRLSTTYSHAKCTRSSSTEVQGSVQRETVVWGGVIPQTQVIAVASACIHFWQRRCHSTLWSLYGGWVISTFFKGKPAPTQHVSCKK